MRTRNQPDPYPEYVWRVVGGGAVGLSRRWGADCRRGTLLLGARDSLTLAWRLMLEGSDDETDESFTDDDAEAALLEELYGTSGCAGGGL